MKKLIFVALATVVAAGALAQGTFTIRRPADGSRVRETVSVRIPKNSIPQGGYLGILVNGKFLEAVVPSVDGADYVYKLDTKKRMIADGKMTIEAVLYMYTEGAPVVLNRSSVSVDLDNSTSITPNENGVALRYKFVPGRELVYNRKQDQSIAMVTQAQAQLGSRAAEIPIDTETIRYMVATDNVYANKNGSREGLIRIQALPSKGKGYAMLTTSGATEPRKYYDYEMHPIYMRISDTGREIFTSLPTYFPLEGTGADARTDLFALLPLPVLPTKRVVLGDKWQSAIPMGDLDLDNKDIKDRFVQNLPGNSTLEKFEWESGIPCAKIRSVIGLGARDLKNIKGLSGVEGEAQSIKLEEIQWIALDRGILVREEGNFTIEQLVEVNSQGTGGGNLGGNDSGAGRGGGKGGPGAPGAGGGRGRASGGDFSFIGNFLGGLNQSTVESLYQSLSGGQQTGGGGAGSASSGEGGPQGGGFGRGGSGNGGGAGVKMILRQRMTYVTTLEK